MNFLDHIVEQKIAEAIARGELRDLPGEGVALELDDDALIPEHLRMAYRILRNAGFAPPEVTTLRQIGDLERQITDLPEVDSRSAALRKLQLLRLRLEASGRFQTLCGIASPYADKLLARLESDDAPLSGRGAGEGNGG